MTMSLSSSVNGKHKQTAYTTNDRSSTSPPDYRSESSSTSPLHMTNLDNSSRINGRIGNGGINGHSVTTLTSSTPRSGHYSHNNNNVIKETMVQGNTSIAGVATTNNSTTVTTNSLRNNTNNSIYNLDHGVANNTIPYNNITSSRRVPDVHSNMDTYDNNSTNYKIVGGNNANSDACHELKKWSEVSSVDKISSPVKTGREDNKHDGLDNTKRRSSNCNNDTNNNNNDNNHLPR